MIEIKTLTAADVGRFVLYERNYCRPERGVLSSWNDKYVFVRFKGPNGEACEPQDVRFEFPMLHNGDGTTSTVIDAEEGGA